MLKYRVGFAVLLAGCWCSPVLAACVVNDADFATAGGGCKDLNTGLVWSPDIRVFDINGLGVYSSNADDAICNQFLNNRPANGGGYTDWRVPTLGEVQEALANGLNSHLDFFLDGGATPDDGNYRWTACKKKVKGHLHTYAIRYTDGDIFLGYLPVYPMICVRGQPRDLTNDCPSGPGKKKRQGGATSALSQTATGALLLLPLGLIAAARSLRPRRP
jgi:hypothetical protein